MALATQKSACNNNLLSQTSSFENRNNLHDASFSSYLNGAEENILVLKLTESSQTPSPYISTPHEHVYAGKKKVEDGEIGVFGAEKYFKGAMDEKKPRIPKKGNNTRFEEEKDEPTDNGPAKPQTQIGPSSVHSESSWNSQSAFLHSIPRNMPRRRTKKGHGKRFLANIGCNCYCNDKNSVEIEDEQIGEKSIPKQPMKNGDLVRKTKSLSKTWAEEEMMQCKKFAEMGNGLKREDCFSFPILNSKVGNPAVKVQLQGEETTRNSMEVFGSPVLEKGNKSFSLERKLTMLNWDSVTPIVGEIVFPTSPNAESDASSDLFELESFSTNANSSFLARKSSDGMSTCLTPTPSYAPSEASIEWSVVTASVADFPVVSDSEELRAAAAIRNPNRILRNGKNTSPGKDMQRRIPGILSGCKSHKAVRVAGDAYEKAGPGPQALCEPDSDSCKTITSLQAETKMTGFDSRLGQRAFDRRSHASHLLYTQ